MAEAGKESFSEKGTDAFLEIVKFTVVILGVALGGGYLLGILTAAL